MNIYEMDQAFTQLCEMLENEEIDEQTFQDTVESLGMDEKEAGYCAVIKNLQNDVANFKTAENELAQKRKRIENNLKRVTDVLREHLLLTGVTKKDADIYKMKISKSQRVEVEDMERLPTEYQRVKTTVEADKTKIKEDIKNGVSVAGAKLVDTYSLKVE